MKARSDAIESEKVDRKAGFLTKTERKYLLGTWAPGKGAEPGEWSEDHERYKRSDIKTRTRHAIADIALLQERADDELVKNVIERKNAPDDISTFYEKTLDHAKDGLSEFLIRLALENEDADELIEYLHGEDWTERFEEWNESVEESKEIAEQHSHYLEPATQNLQNYAEANDISKEQMKNAIDILWSE